MCNPMLTEMHIRPFQNFSTSSLIGTRAYQNSSRVESAGSMRLNSNFELTVQKPVDCWPCCGNSKDDLIELLSFCPFPTCKIKDRFQEGIFCQTFQIYRRLRIKTYLNVIFRGGPRPTSKTTFKTYPIVDGIRGIYDSSKVIWLDFTPQEART